MNWLIGRPKVVLITGCNSGIGLALVRSLYGADGYITIATARDQSISSLRRAFQEGERFWVRRLDVAEPSAVGELIEEINQKLGGVDVLINNAGVSYRSVIEDMDDESEMHQLRMNYLGPMTLIRAVLPTMREKGMGNIINISSMSGMIAMPTMGSYSASKHALEGATEALWYETRGFGIKVSLIQPGFVRSGSFYNVLFSRKAKVSRELAGPYSDIYTKMSPFIERLMGLSAVSPDRIAEKILALLDNRDPPLWNSVTPDASLFGILRKYIPRSVFHKLVYTLLPGSKSWGFHFIKKKRKMDLSPASENENMEILTASSIQPK